jgi:catechol 2,3-dioxygenase-like lactoylglutathione lyase family enzyme
MAQNGATDRDIIGNAPRLNGVLETSLYVENLERAKEFYRALFSFKEFFTDDRMCAMEIPPSQVLLLFRRGATLTPAPMHGGWIPPHGGTGSLHLCFGIPLRELAKWEAHLQRLDIALLSKLTGPKGGTSLYFRDPDDNLLEIATPGLWPNY